MRISDLESIPFRIRIGIVANADCRDWVAVVKRIREVIELRVRDLFDEDSKKRIRAASHTPLAYSALASSSSEAERLVTDEILRLPNTKLELVRDSVAMSSHYVVDHCDLLIALHDGKATGTTNASEIIAYAMKQQRPVIRISAAAPHDITVERGHGLNARSISGIERFNAFVVSPAEQQAYISNLCAELFKENYDLPEDAKREARELLMPFYVRASNLAKRSQELYRRAALLVYCFSALAVTAVAVGTLFNRLSIWAFALELVLLLSILGIVFYANQQRTHRKWIESRFLTERIRAAIFLAVCGVEPSQISVPPYMGFADQPDEWMVMTFNEIWSRLPPRQGCSGESCTMLQTFVRERWVRDQIKFHEKKARDSERMSRLLERGGIVAFGLALLAAALHLILSAMHVEHLEKPLILLAISLPAVGAAIGGIRTHREYSRLAKRSRNMVVNLRKLDERFASGTDPQTLETLLRETERLMLLETQDWLMLMSFARLETV